MTIEIFLRNKGFEKPVFHYEQTLNRFFLFINTKKQNRNLKNYEKAIKKYLSSTKINFLINNNYKDIKINN